MGQCVWCGVVWWGTLLNQHCVCFYWHFLLLCLWPYSYRYMAKRRYRCLVVLFWVRLGGWCQRKRKLEESSFFCGMAKPVPGLGAYFASDLPVWSWIHMHWLGFHCMSCVIATRTRSQFTNPQTQPNPISFTCYYLFFSTACMIPYPCHMPLLPVHVYSTSTYGTQSRYGTFWYSHTTCPGTP